MVRKAWHLLLVVMLLAAVALVPGCDYSGGETAAVAEENVEDLPPIESPEKGNRKLRSGLNNVIAAYERGEAEEYARQSDIKLIDGDKVRVVIWCEPDQAEAAADIASALGEVELITRSGLVQVVVPITSLTALAEAESIRFIELARSSQAEASQE